MSALLPGEVWLRVADPRDPPLSTDNQRRVVIQKIAYGRVLWKLVTPSRGQRKAGNPLVATFLRNYRPTEEEA